MILNFGDSMSYLQYYT